MFSKSLVAAAALWSLADAAAATTTALGPATVGTSLTFAGAARQGLAFADIFTFFLPLNGRGSGYVVSNFALLDSLDGAVLSSFSLVRNLDGIVGNGDDTVLAIQDVGAAGGGLTFGGIAGGSYYLKVAGSGNGTQGDSYTGAISVAISVAALAIPEPATCALMLAGLGGVGFVAGRRRCGRRCGV